MGSGSENGRLAFHIAVSSDTAICNIKSQLMHLFRRIPTLAAFTRRTWNSRNEFRGSAKAGSLFETRPARNRANRRPPLEGGGCVLF